MEGFDARVRAVLASVTEGQIVSYGWVARQAGRPRAARAVGALLGRDGDELPWWRVVRADGRLVSPQPREQARRLRREGVPVRGNRVMLPPEPP